MNIFGTIFLVEPNSRSLIPLCLIEPYLIFSKLPCQICWIGEKCKIMLKFSWLCLLINSFVFSEIFFFGISNKHYKLVENIVRQKFGKIINFKQTKSSSQKRPKLKLFHHFIVNNNQYKCWRLGISYKFINS